MSKVLEKIKIKFHEFLENLGNSNEENFGNKKLDCCDLNKNKKKTKDI